MKEWVECSVSNSGNIREQFILKMYETVEFLQYLLPYNQKVTQHFHDAVPAITSNMYK